MIYLRNVGPLASWTVSREATSVSTPVTRPSPEQIDYLRWYERNAEDNRGGEDEYPFYDTDGSGRVQHPGYALETSWDAIVANSNDDDDTDSAEAHGKLIEVDGRLATAGDVPSPDRALTEYLDFEGIDVLSEREKDVFLLTHVCLMEPRQVAKYLGIGVGTVKTHLIRAKRKLRR